MPPFEAIIAQPGLLAVPQHGLFWKMTEEHWSLHGSDLQSRSQPQQGPVLHIQNPWTLPPSDWEPEQALALTVSKVNMLAALRSGRVLLFDAGLFRARSAGKKQGVSR